MTFNLQQPLVPEQTSEHMDGQPSDVSSPLVLVVEDHEDTRDMLKVMLELRGCRVLEAEDGEAAVGLAQSEHPNLILMDVRLPRLDGLSATRRIREHASLREVPIVALTCLVNPEFRATSLAAGCSDYLTKPISFRQLDQLLERLLKRADREKKFPLTIRH